MPPRLNRRALLALGTGSILGLGTVGNHGLRLNQKISRVPDLRNGHLVSLRDASPENAAPRVLLVGNSALIVSGFLQKLEEHAACSGRNVRFARAAAYGARLIISLRIAELRRLIGDVSWDVIVLQDFSSVPLDRADRFASTVAINTFARIAGDVPLVLFPHWPSGPNHRVYGEGLGWRYRIPTDIRDYAHHAQSHYNAAAEDTGATVAPLLQRWVAAIESGQSLYKSDKHHANETGAELAAGALWHGVEKNLRVRQS
ncbi:MAG: hypothetical protein AAFQ28_01185 [Pseudomonadota bacterium]